MTLNNSRYGLFYGTNKLSHSWICNIPRRIYIPRYARVQLEAVARACQRHEMKPGQITTELSFTRPGFLLADGNGLGKVTVACDKVMLLVER